MAVGQLSQFAIALQFTLVIGDLELFQKQPSKQT
jgi:hypothetical protein